MQIQQQQMPLYAVIATQNRRTGKIINAKVYTLAQIKAIMSDDIRSSRYKQKQRERKEL